MIAAAFQRRLASLVSWSQLSAAPQAYRSFLAHRGAAAYHSTARFFRFHCGNRKSFMHGPFVRGARKIKAFDEFIPTLVSSYFVEGVSYYDNLSLSFAYLGVDESHAYLFTHANNRFVKLVGLLRLTKRNAKYVIPAFSLLIYLEILKLRDQWGHVCCPGCATPLL